MQNKQAGSFVGGRLAFCCQPAGVHPMQWTWDILAWDIPGLAFWGVALSWELPTTVSWWHGRWHLPSFLPPLVAFFAGLFSPAFLFFALWPDFWAFGAEL